MHKVRVSLLMAGLLFVGAACEDDESGSAGVTEEDGGGAGSSPIAFTGGEADCLQGTWVESSARLQQFMNEMGGPMVFTVMPDSVLTMVMAGDAVNVTSTITLQAAIADTIMQTTGSGSYAGTYTADGSTLDVALTFQEFVAGDWMISVDGETATAPGMAPVEIGAPIVGLGSYTCTDATLVVVASGHTSTFDRA